jgi:hypothetical protein
MKNYFVLSLLLSLLFSTPAFTGSGPDSERIELTKNDYLTLIVGNYVHGFKEFETSVTASNGAVNITIFYSSFFDNKARVYWLTDLFQMKIPEILKQYSWAKDVTINVEVYSERRAGGGFLK